jgi:hypothetical protein
MRRGIAWFLGLGVGAALLGCVSPSDPLGRQAALADVQRRYTELVRWGDLRQASGFVRAELREEFMGLAGPLETLRISDTEIGDIEWEDESAFVTVTYTGYSVAHLVEHTSRERQEWVHIGGIKNDAWRVRPQLDIVVDELRGRKRSAAEQ